MKYLITESQLDKVIFRYLNNRDFIQIDINDSIYFVISEDEEYAQIRYDDELCYINLNLITEISSFFSLGRDESQRVISRWVENTLKMKVTTTLSGKKFDYQIS